eukprot:Rhum_TRINITY_DN8113_c0_g1::Rhum_TRINITY_DN8113_c0_g1_i1::g.26316::m.26316
MEDASDALSSSDSSGFFDDVGAGGSGGGGGLLLLGLESVSDACGWLAVAGFLVTCVLSGGRVLMSHTKPSRIVTATQTLADFANCYGSVLAAAPEWQLVVACVFLFHDFLLVYCVRAMHTPVGEVSTSSLRRAFVVSVALSVVCLAQSLATVSTERALAIQLGTVSALCNISTRLWRIPLHPAGVPPPTHSYISIASQVLYSAAIVLHPDRQKGKPYVEESAPWVVGSIVSALLEFNSVSELQTRFRKHSRRESV